MALLSAGCGTTRTVSGRYPEVESLVLARLGVDKRELTETEWQQTQIRVGDELARWMGMRVFTVQLDDYVPDDHISFTASHSYDIGATGGEYVDFSIRREDANRTRVSVDYSDRAAGCCLVVPLPFAYANPGVFREKKIAEYILRENPEKKPAGPAIGAPGGLRPPRLPR